MQMMWWQKELNQLRRSPLVLSLVRVSLKRCSSSSIVSSLMTFRYTKVITFVELIEEDIHTQMHTHIYNTHFFYKKLLKMKLHIFIFMWDLPLQIYLFIYFLSYNLYWLFLGSRGFFYFFFTFFLSTSTSLSGLPHRCDQHHLLHLDIDLQCAHLSHSCSRCERVVHHCSGLEKDQQN